MTSTQPRPRILTVREFGYDQLRALERQGDIERIRRGAYRRHITAANPWDARREALLTLCAAVTDRLSTRFAFSHSTGAVIRRWPARFDPRQVEITQVGNPNGRRDSDIRRHADRTLCASDIVEIGGLPVLAAELNAVQCARTLPPREGLAVVDKALQQLAQADRRRREQSLVREAAVRAHLQEILTAAGASRNVVRAREVLTYATGLSGSPQESVLRCLALAIGLPEPLCEWEQRIDGVQYFSDLAWLACADDWPKRAITFEYDGDGKYGDVAPAILQAVAEEKRRQDAIESTSVAVHRVTNDRLRNTTTATMWMLSKFPPSTLAFLTPRPGLRGPIRRTPGRLRRLHAG